MTAPKVVAIGIGSFTFGVELLRDVFQTDELRGCELTLVDLDAERLGLMTAVAERLNEASGWQARVVATQERGEALPGAGFVVTAVEVNRDALWKLDHEICLRNGVASVLSENGGPGGLSHALRTVPIMLDIAHDIERLAPNALLLNYTNPEGRICLAIRRQTSVRTVGLCHGVAGTIPFVAGVLGKEPGEIDLRAAGVNHFTWTTSLTDKRSGDDLYPAFRARLASLPADDRPLCRLLYERFGCFPTTGDNHVGEYIGWAAELCGTEGYDFDAVAEQRRGALENVQCWGDGTKPVEPLLAQPSREARVGTSAVRIMADSLARRESRVPSVIVPNDGYIENVSRDAVVEVPGLVEGGYVRGMAVGALPGPVAAMVQNEVEIQKLVVDAAVSGSRDLALAALLIDPVVNSARKAEALLDDILSSHAAYLPRFAQAVAR
ncbi:MAG: alpha-glucosidase/alpha-galactosidase [Dehalococcoidia bacterium]